MILSEEYDVTGTDLDSVVVSLEGGASEAMMF